jgi:tetratricopeptide (TPR) repeat protein
MNAETRKRVVLYGLTLVVLSGLAYGGFVYEADPDFDTILGNAEGLANYGRPDDGIELAKTALAERPDHRYAHIIIAHCYTRMEEFDRAITWYRRAVELTPQDDSTRDPLILYLAEALARAGMEEEAHAEADGVLERSPDLLSAYVFKASLCHATGDSEGAMATLRTGMENLPDAHQLPSLLAEIEYEVGDVDGARRHLQQAEKMARTRLDELEADLEGLEGMPEANPLRSEAAGLKQALAGVFLGLARICAAEGNQHGAELRILDAAALDRRLTARTVASDELLKPLLDVPEVAAGLTSTASAGVENN